jgi:transcriptional regulatory protein LevR
MSKFRQRQIDLPVDVRARNLFFSRYVTGNNRAFEYMQSFASDTSQHLEASIEAVSLAQFSVKANSSRIMDKARRKYVLALQLTNRILQVPEQATKDVTMLAILLLDLFGAETKRGALWK